MKTIKITEGKLTDSKILRRQAWVIIAQNQIIPNHLDILAASFTPRKNYEKIIIEYPDYVAGTRQGEAHYLHLPSYPTRILHRLHRAVNE